MVVWPMGPYLQIDPLSPIGRGGGSSKLPPISSEPPGFSKLDVLKEQLQQRLERERQTKLTAMYRHQYHQALLRLRATCLTQAPRPPQPYRAEEQQPGWLPGAKRCPGIDRSQPLKPIDRAAGPCSDVNPGDPGSDWQRLPRQEAPQWPGLSYRPSPHKATSNRDRETELEPPRPLHRGWAGQRPQPCLLADQGRSLTHARSRENLIEQQLRRIEAELRDIQRQREEEEEEDEEGVERVEIMRMERERGWQRERRDSLGRHRSEEERSEGESSEGERWRRSEGEESEGDRERSERKRSERQRSKRAGERSRRSEGEKPGRHWSESERGKKEIGSEREERGRVRERTRREKWERSQKDSLGEIEREVKLKDRVRVKGESRVGGGNWECANGHRAGRESDRREGGSDREAAVRDESPQVVEDFDHSNPFAGYTESPAEVKLGSRNTEVDETEHGDGEHSEDVGWDGHYSPEEKAHCSHCGRRFVLDRLDTHMEICKKVYKRKRKIYDSAQKRAKGTDLENYQCNHKIVPIPKVNWKRKHDSFIRMLHAAQQAELEVYRRRKAAQTAPAGANRLDFMQCPSCSRRFEHSVAEGHIPKCMSLRSWPGPSKR